MLTPASTRAELKRKEECRASGEFEYLAVNVEAVDRLIGADDAFLLANAPRRRKGVPS